MKLWEESTIDPSLAIIHRNLTAYSDACQPTVIAESKAVARAQEYPLHSRRLDELYGGRSCGKRLAYSTKPPSRDADDAQNRAIALMWRWAVRRRHQGDVFPKFHLTEARDLSEHGSALAPTRADEARGGPIPGAGGFRHRDKIPDNLPARVGETPHVEIDFGLRLRRRAWRSTESH
jgi:hypothetical protein